MKGKPQSFPRVPTGVPQMDLILHGGFLEGGTYVVGGAPGTGKTILANQISFHHVAGGGRAVYVTLLTESHGRLLGHIGQLSFFDPAAVGRSLHYVSAFGALRKDPLQGLTTTLRKVIKQHRATLLVVDGIARIDSFAPSVVDLKQFVYELNVLCELSRCTALLLTDSTADSGMGYPAKTMVDGLIELRDNLEGLRAKRDLIVSKFRGSAFLRGVHFYDIDGNGIRIFPRVEAQLATPSRDPVVPKMRLSFGIAGLDRMTGGGLSEGTTTMVLGSSGREKHFSGCTSSPPASRKRSRRCTSGSSSPLRGCSRKGTSWVSI